MWLFLAVLVGVGSPGDFVLGGVRMPIAEWGRTMPTQRTHSAVATTGGVNVLGPWPKDELGLAQGSLSVLGQSKAERTFLWSPPRRPPRSRPEPARNGRGWYCTPRSQVMH